MDNLRRLRVSAVDLVGCVLSGLPRYHPGLNLMGSAMAAKKGQKLSVLDGIGIAALGGVTALIAYVAGAFQWAGHPDAAEWVQAIGSVLAIGATGLGVEWQHRRQQQAARAATRARFELMVRAIGTELQKGLHHAQVLQRSLASLDQFLMHLNAELNMVDNFDQVNATLASITFREVPLPRVLVRIHLARQAFGRIRAIAHSAARATVTSKETLDELSSRLNRPMYLMRGPIAELTSFTLVESDEIPE